MLIRQGQGQPRSAQAGTVSGEAHIEEPPSDSLVLPQLLTTPGFLGNRLRKNSI